MKHLATGAALAGLMTASAAFADSTIKFGHDNKADPFENPAHAYTQALMKAVPIADPRQRKDEKDLNFKPIPSPIHPVSYRPEPSVYNEVEPGHFILTTDSGY